MDRGELLVDKRIVERNIRRGLISRQDYEAHLAALADCSDNIAEEPKEEAGATPFSAAG
ncbi:MAG: hypothetical protein ACPGUV_07910 [Polyangiales bacterium]